MDLEVVRFCDLSLDAAFFDSLREDYPAFDEWFLRKSSETAIIARELVTRDLQGFLNTKVEDGPFTDVSPSRAAARRLKVGTMKVVPHGTRLGERLIKKVFDHAAEARVDEIYVTVFERHHTLIELFYRYGFERVGQKHTNGRSELVLARQLRVSSGDPLTQYPALVRGSRCWLLGIYPEWHTRLFPDSKLHNEGPDIVQDVSHSNSIHKIYLCGMKGIDQLQRGDILVIYRTGDGKGPARYRSVATSICVVEERSTVDDWRDEATFIEDCEKYSVFDASELKQLWQTKKYPSVIRFTYNLALPRRPTRAQLIENKILTEDDYAGFCSLSWSSLEKILQLASSNAAVVVDPS
ncbi:MAG: hypothetical protein U0269_19675 [Polyangiales bacterium]